MIVNAETLDVFPSADKILEKQAGRITNDVNRGTITWSNELVLHVVELKTTLPEPSLQGLSRVFHENILDINALLRSTGGRLMPGAMHPWMNPDKETHLWPHEYNAIYESYNRIFDCRGHGWTNLQSTHLNLPFQGDKEFEKLHAAIRVLLPLIPALSASSPLADGKIQEQADYRMDVYRTNSIKIPSVTGKIIPEQVFSTESYRKKIFETMYRDIAPFDPDGILQDEWLNSRGAIARFDRGSIEIRVIDIQECPKADLAVLELIIMTLKALINQSWSSTSTQKTWHEDNLYPILMDAVKDGEQAIISDKNYLQLFGFPGSSASTAEVWYHLYEETNRMEAYQADTSATLKTILKEGTLSKRILNSLPSNFTREDLKLTYSRLCDSLERNELFV